MTAGDPSIAAIEDDNRVPEFRAGEHRVLKNMARFGLRRLRSGAPPARRLLSRPSPSVFRAWAPWIAGPCLLAALLLIVPLSGYGGLAGAIIAGLAAALSLFLGLAAAVFAAGIDSTVPPPPRPDCQAETLGGAPHPFAPFYRETGLVPYVPGQLWMAQIPLVFHGLQMGTRMVVARMGDSGALLVYSPVPLDDAMKAQVEALGRVAWIVAPNVLHHLHVGAWLEAFPEAEAWAAPNLAARRSDLPWAGTIADSGTAVPWSRDIVDVVVLKGHAFHQEVVLFHRPSRTVILADALENLGHRPEASGKLVHLLGLFGMAGRPTPPTDLKLTISQRERAAQAVHSVLAWDFDRIILAHGRLIERDARAAFADGWAFLRDCGR